MQKARPSDGLFAKRPIASKSTTAIIVLNNTNGLENRATSDKVIDHNISQH